MPKLGGTSKKMSDIRRENSGAEMEFWDHFAALRPHLVRGAVAVVVIAIVAFLSKHFLIDIVLFGPKSADFPTNRLLLATGEQLAVACEWFNQLTGFSWSINLDAFDVSNLNFNVINTSMAGQFNLHMKISFVTGLVLAMPYVLWEFWRFVKPALNAREIAATQRFVFWVSFFFFIGLLFGYFVIVPLSVSFFINYQASTSIVNLIDVNQYLSTVIVASLASALVFQLPLLIYFLTRMGLVSAAFMKRYRRHAFVGLLVIAAIITPPDIFSLVLVIIPLYWLYELSIRLATRVERQQAKEQKTAS
ncbi:MAG: twin-arginine translocase subunit TatC [Alistipes sp.]